MLKIVNSIVNIGCKADDPSSVKIRMTNTIGLFMILIVGVPFVIISILVFPTLTYIPAAGIGALILAIFFNFLRVHLLAKILTSLIPAVLAVSYSASVTTASEVPHFSIMLIGYSFSFVAILVFDIKKEWGWTAFVSVIIVGIFLNYPAFNSFLEKPIDDEVLRTGWLGKLSTFLAFALGFTNIITLVIINFKTEQKMTLVLDEATKNNSALKKSEETLNVKLQEIEDKKNKEDERNWVANGVADFGEVLRENNDDMDALASTVISFLVKHIKANQGGVFVLNENGEEPVLELKGVYAYNKNKFFLNRSVEKREGLIGQCWFEEEEIIITEVPDNFVNITSGLGEALPKSIILMPLILHEKVYGVLEIASFKVFKSFEVEFIRKSCENMASIISSYKVNEKTKLLLDETQKMSHQLQSQEEELRQYADDLMATQEDQEKKIQDLEAQLKKYQDG